VASRDGHRLSRVFWRSHDVADVLGRWAAVVPEERVHVVTAPAGSDQDQVLWGRFARAVRIENARMRAGSDTDGRLDAGDRAPVECADGPPGHGVCGCYTICIKAVSPHARNASARIVDVTARDLSESLFRGDLNLDGVTDTADLGILLGAFGAGETR